MSQLVPLATLLQIQATQNDPYLMSDEGFYNGYGFS